MNDVVAWLLVNLFILALIACGAAVFWLLVGLASFINPWAMAVAALASLVVTGWLMARIHRWLERLVNRRAH